MLNSSNSSSEPEMDKCSFPSVLTMVFVWMVIYTLFLPLFLSVLYVGNSQKKPSHSDVFTFHIVAMEILTTLGTYAYFLGGKLGLFPLQSAGSTFYCIGLIGQMLIHALTCVERYLAVVHPITYLRLKKRGGVIIRNISIAVVWMFSVGSMCYRYAHHMQDNYFKLCLFTTACCIILVVGFCSVSVLCVLIRPGPGEVGGQLRRIDQSKRRAFSTIIAIASVLVLRFIFLIVMYLFPLVSLLSIYDSCLLTSSAGCVTFPSSLVLPLLFLQRAGKLQEAHAWCQGIMVRSNCSVQSVQFSCKVCVDLCPAFLRCVQRVPGGANVNSLPEC